MYTVCAFSFCFSPDENVEHHVGTENPPPPITANTEPLVEAKQETETQNAPPPKLGTHSLASAADMHSSSRKDEQSPPSLPLAVASATPPTEAINQVEAKVSDTVDAPVPSASLAKKEAPVETEGLDSCSEGKGTDEKKTDEVKKLKDVVSTKLEVAVEDTVKANPVYMENEEMTTEQLATETSELPPSKQEPSAPQNQSATLKSEPETKATSVETPDLPLANGLPRETEELPDLSCSDTSPLDEPDPTHSQEPAPVASIPTQEEMAKEEEKLKASQDDPPSTVGSPAEESTTMQCKIDLIYTCYLKI